MKIIKVEKLNFVNYKSNKGMVMFEFMIVLFLSLILLLVFIEIGYILKSETVVMAVTKKAVREINVSGVFTTQIRDEIINTLNKNKIEVTRIHLNVEHKYFYEVLTGEVNEPILFRQDYAVTVCANHNLKAITFGKTYPIKIPLIFGQGGRGEVWTTDSLKNYY